MLRNDYIIIKWILVNGVPTGTIATRTDLTGEYPNVTVCYKQKMTFFNAKFDQICSTFFRPPKSSKTFGHCPVN